MALQDTLNRTLFACETSLTTALKTPHVELQIANCLLDVGSRGREFESAELDARRDLARAALLRGGEAQRRELLVTVLEERLSSRPTDIYYVPSREQPLV